MGKKREVNKTKKKKERIACCEKEGLRRGAWTTDEDNILVDFITQNGHGGSWRNLPKLAGLLRCGKSCRLRWINYLRPDIKRGPFSPDEENTIIHLQYTLGNKWSAIASHLPGRTDNDIKNLWNTHLRKRLSDKILKSPNKSEKYPSNKILESPNKSDLVTKHESSKSCSKSYGHGSFDVRVESTNEHDHMGDVCHSPSSQTPSFGKTDREMELLNCKNEFVYLDSSKSYDGLVDDSDAMLKLLLDFIDIED